MLCSYGDAETSTVEVPRLSLALRSTFRPCSVHLCSLLLDAAAPLIVPSLQNDSLEALRRIHRSYRQQAGLHSPVTAADSELASSPSERTQRTTNADGVAGGSPGTSSYVAPVIIRAAAWIVGEYN